MRHEQFHESELALLTAGVDGELSRRELADLRNLLAMRRDAAELFAQLKADAALVHALPPAPAPKGSLSAIIARLPVTTPAKSKHSTNRMPAWMPVAVAASLLFTVGSVSYLYFNVQKQQADANGVREQLPALPPNVVADEPDHDSVVLAKAKPAPRTPRQDGKPGPVEEFPTQNQHTQTPKPREQAPLPRSIGGDVLGGGILDRIKPLIGADVRLNPIIDAADLGNMDVQNFLMKELTRDPAFRLDLFGKTPTVGLDALQKAAKAAGITILVDAKTQDLLNRKVPVTLAIYTEALTPAEVAALLAELAKQVKATNPRAIGPTHLIPAGAAEARDTKELLGVDLQLLKMPKVGAANGDPKPLSADTVGKIASTVKKGDKPAILLAYLPVQTRTPAIQSKEVKDYLTRKGDRKPGTVAMLFVVR